MDITFNTENAIFNFRVAGVWINNGHVLLHKDVKDTQWSLPGGRVRTLEDTNQSLIREFYEELHLDINIGKLFWIIENFFHYRGKDFHEIGFYYAISTDESSFIDKEAFHGVEGDRLLYKWFPVNSLEKVELYPIVLRNAFQKLPDHTKHIINNELHVREGR